MEVQQKQCERVSVQREDLLYPNVQAMYHHYLAAERTFRRFASGSRSPMMLLYLNLTSSSAPPHHGTNHGI